jgi:nicotinamidase-related amidase
MLASLEQRIDVELLAFELRLYLLVERLVRRRLDGIAAMSKSDILRRGPPGESAVHLCVDMQRMFAEGTDWKMPWLERVLPNIVAVTCAHPEGTVFTRFIPAEKPGHGVGMWRHYYERWASMTIDQIGQELIGLVPELVVFVPPARVFDKHVYSPWTGSNLHQQLRGAGIDTIIITGGETDVCVLSTTLGAIDWGIPGHPCTGRALQFCR